ncbi:ABC transporter substrate-binding protein, partial [Salmonella enterica subsp. enterica serovar Virchow]|nr:ABC transporter substrate-binding protein [Salmonella enterica subsp. enterica serovar Virchow]
MRHYLLALCLLFVSTCVFSAPAEVPPEPALRIATPWPAQ